MAEKLPGITNHHQIRGVSHKGRRERTGENDRVESE